VAKRFATFSSVQLDKCVVAPNDTPLAVGLSYSVTVHRLSANAPARAAKALHVAEHKKEGVVSIPEMLRVRMSELAGDGPVPEGMYVVRVHKASFVASPKNPNAGPYIATWLMITGPDEAEACIGRIIFANYPLTGKATYRIHDLLLVTGHDDDFVLEDASQLLDLELRVIVAVEKGSNGYPDKSVVKKHLLLA
jgi:hypothetical protein